MCVLCIIEVRGQLQVATHKAFLHLKDILAAPLLLLLLLQFSGLSPHQLGGVGGLRGSSLQRSTAPCVTFSSDVWVVLDIRSQKWGWDGAYLAYRAVLSILDVDLLKPDTDCFIPEPNLDI